MTLYIIGPPATKLLGLSFVIHFRDLKLPFVEYYNHEVMEPLQELKLLPRVIGDYAVGGGFLVVEFD
jgi:hypothetical protein